LQNLNSLFTDNLKDSKLNDNSSSVLELSLGLHTSVDVMAYECMERDQPPQYLIALSLPLLVSNYNFQAMELRDHNNNVLTQIGPKETSALHSIDCVNTKPELIWCAYEP